jgi:hypothetical protein
MAAHAPANPEPALSQFLAQFVTAAAVGALSPVAVMATIAVLTAEHHRLRNAFGLLLGWSLVLVVIAAALLALFSGNGSALSDATKAVLNLVVGVLLLSFGLRNLLGAKHPLSAAAEGNPGRHTEPPRWMRSLDTLTLLKAVGVGGVLLCVSPADLAVYMSALNGIAGKGVGARLLLTAALLVAIDLCILIPIGIYLAMPARANEILEKLRQWLIAHQLKLMAWVCTTFGVLLIVSAVIKLA